MRVFRQLALPIGVFAVFLLLSLGSRGPVYLSDEIGYLSKAITLAGDPVQLASSWFAGYAYMISPAFILSSDPLVSWRLVLIMNAGMWAGSAWLLHYVLRKLQPHASARTIMIATIGAMLYPSWLSMSGYAFATSGLVLIFMGSLAALIKSDLHDWRWLTVSALLGAYLAWMHPLGLVFAGLLATVIAINALLQRHWSLLVVAGVCLAVAASYITLIHPLFNAAMQGSLPAADHYSQEAAGLTAALTTPSYWLRVIMLTLGMLFTFIVASFGLIIFGLLPALQRIWAEKRQLKNLLRDTHLVATVLPAVSIVGVIGITALTWATHDRLRIDQWTYARYGEMFIMPLLGLGIIVGWRIRPALWMSGFALAVGGLLTALTNNENTSFVYINKVNLQSLWPMHAASAINVDQYWLWGVLASIGIATIAFIGMKRREVALVLLILPVTFCGLSNNIYRHQIATDYTTPTALYDYIRTNYSQTDCIGFTTKPDVQERYNLYSYYLRGYNLSKLNYEDWEAKDCRGVYLTYDSQAGEQLQKIDAEPDKGLFGFERSTRVSFQSLSEHNSGHTSSPGRP